MGNQTFCKCIISDRKNIESKVNIEILKNEIKVKENDLCKSSPQINKEETNISKNNININLTSLCKNEELIFTMNEKKEDFSKSSFQMPNLSFVKIHRKIKSVI